MAIKNSHSNGHSGQRSVCIIGAGAAGLCALRHFTRRPEFSSVVCYEQTNQIGGTWNYSQKTGTDDNGLPLHTSMYRDLHTNLPMQIMQFPDFEWPHRQSFVHHSRVLQYLRDYAHHYDLLPYIKLEHHLTHLTRVDDQWQATVHSYTENRIYTQQFDIVLLCPGRHSRPFYPTIKALDDFTGQVIHSHDYRYREPYSNQKVAIIGGGPSGFDLVIEVGTVASEVVFINRTAFQFENLPANVRQINGEIEQFTANSMIVKLKENGELVEFNVESVILATGYLFNLDYLDQETTGLRLNEDDTLDGLYRQMVNIKHPSMAILGICQKGVLPFPMYHQQILYYIKLLLGEMATPSVEEMEKEVREDLLMRAAIGYRPKDRHCLKVELLAEYIQRLEEDAQLKPLKPVVMKLHGDLYTVRCRNVVGYKRLNYRLLDEQTYEEDNSDAL